MRTIVLYLLFSSFIPVKSQCKFDILLGTDVYQWYKNPVDPQVTDSPGSAGQIFGINAGFKFSGGGSNIGLAAECGGNFAPLAFDFPRYKGLGAAAYYVLGKINFGALTGFSKDQLFGFSVGAGLQYSRTELFGLIHKYDYLSRKWFQTYIGEIAVGGGFSQFLIMAYFRLGTSKEKAWTLQQGVQLSYRLF